MYKSSQSQFAFQVYVNYEFVKKTFSVFEEVNLQSLLGHDTSLQSSDLQRSKLRKKNLINQDGIKKSCARILSQDMCFFDPWSIYFNPNPYG